MFWTKAVEEEEEEEEEEEKKIIFSNLFLKIMLFMR
jgi:hypothetical protein